MAQATAAGAISWRHVAPGAPHPAGTLGGDEIHVWRLSAGRRSGDLSVRGLLARYDPDAPAMRTIDVQRR